MSRAENRTEHGKRAEATDESEEALKIGPDGVRCQQSLTELINYLIENASTENSEIGNNGLATDELRDALEIGPKLSV